MGLSTQTANYVNISELPQGKEVRNWLFNYGDVNFGDASLTLINPQRMKDELDMWDEVPLVFLEALVALPPETYIDLETP